MATKKDEKVKDVNIPKAPEEIPVKSKDLEKPGQIIMEKQEEIPVEVENQGAGEPQEAGAAKWVNRYTYWSMGAGLIPIPLVDLCTVAGVQLKMLHRLSQHYGVQFSENRGKSIVAALTGTLSADMLRKSTLTSFIKSIPLVGIIGSAAMPIYSGAATYAIGKLFIHHFETGGTFLDFDLKKVKTYFANLYEEGISKVRDLKGKYRKSEPLEV